MEIRFANEFEHVAKLVSKNPGLENPGSGLVSCISAVNTLKSFGCGRLTVIVGDASVALTWVLPDTDQNVAYSARVADAGISGSDELVAPRLLTAECSCRLLK